MRNNKTYLRNFFFIVIGVFAFIACEKEDEAFEETRMFRPVLNEGVLRSERNTIIVDLAKMKRAEYYTIEVSRDSFATVEYVIESDTNYVVVNEDLVGEELFWSTLYQVRAKAHAEDPQYDSEYADLGSVRTQRFPTILNVPAPYDVIDTAARVTWTTAGAPVTGIKIFAPEDLKLSNPLFETRPVTDEEREAAEAIVTGLDPLTEYQIALYSEDELRGWVTYETLEQDIDPTAPGVIDIRDNESPTAVADAVATAPDGAVILVKRGVTYEFPEDDLDKSITIRAAYGFGEKKAQLFTTGNWNVAEGSNIDHIRFIGLEVRGEDFEGDYVFNINEDDVFIGELLFEDTHLTNFRGITRIRSTTIIDDYIINNSVVDSLGGYGIITADTDPAEAGEPQTATVNNIFLTNSTFNYINTGIQSRNNSQSIVIDNSTFANFIETGGRFLRYRGSDGNNNVTNGILIHNSIFGHSWDVSGEGNYGIQGIGDGLENTNFDLNNIWSTRNFSFRDGTEIPGFPVGNYSGTQNQLWVDVPDNNFNFQDGTFPGRFDSGDPRWRVRL